MSELQKFAENIWVASGPPARDMGLLFTTRMTIVKLSDGSIWISSPVPVSFDTLKQITELGTVCYLIAATPRHVWRLSAAHILFPDAQLWACRHTLFTLQKGPLPFAGILGDVPPDMWVEDFDQLAFKGNPWLSEVLFFHKKSHTLILDDLIQSNQAMEGHPIRNAIFKLEGGFDTRAGVGLDMRLAFFNRDLARQSLEKLLSWDFDKLIIAHGDCVTQNAKQFVERAFQWLEK